MTKWFLLLTLVLAVTFVIVRGQREERLVACTLLLVSISTGLLYILAGQRFERVSLPLILNEAVLLAVTLTVAYRSSRFWPMPVASLEIAAFLTLLAPLFGKNLVSYALGVTQSVWAYPQLAILVLAVVRGRRRTKAIARRTST